MVTVKELFDYAIETDSAFLAHGLYLALSHNLVRLDDDARTFKTTILDAQEIRKLTDENFLGIGKIKLFVIETNRQHLFAFYFAENVLDACRLHEELFREQAGKVVRADRLMGKFMSQKELKNDEWLYDYRKRYVTFPAYLGHAEAGSEVLYKLEVSA